MLNTPKVIFNNLGTLLVSAANAPVPNTVVMTITGIASQ